MLRKRGRKVTFCQRSAERGGGGENERTAAVPEGAEAGTLFNLFELDRGEPEERIQIQFLQGQKEGR